MCDTRYVYKKNKHWYGMRSLMMQDIACQKQLLNIFSKQVQYNPSIYTSKAHCQLLMEIKRQYHGFDI